LKIRPAFAASAQPDPNGGIFKALKPNIQTVSGVVPGGAGKDKKFLPWVEK